LLAIDLIFWLSNLQSSDFYVSANIIIVLSRYPHLLMIDAVLGNIGGSSWGISSIFGGGDKSARENVASKQHAEPFHSVEVEQSFSMIHLTEVYIL